MIGYEEELVTGPWMQVTESKTYHRKIQKSIARR